MNQEEEIEFYKDGYTDMCGRFSYAVLSGSTVKNIKKFALLISSEDYGSMVKTVDPPIEMGVMERVIDVD